MTLYIAARSDDPRIMNGTLPEARAAAEQLARQHPGIEFIVFRATARVVTEPDIPVRIETL